MTNMTDAAKAALLSTGTNRQGSVPTHPMTEDVERELKAAGYLGRGNGLTRAGSIARQRANVIPF